MEDFHGKPADSILIPKTSLWVQHDYLRIWPFYFDPPKRSQVIRPRYNNYENKYFFLKSRFFTDTRVSYLTKISKSSGNFGYFK